jgi:threonine synthase
MDMTELVCKQCGITVCITCGEDGICPICNEYVPDQYKNLNKDSSMLMKQKNKNFDFLNCTIDIGRKY